MTLEGGRGTLRLPRKSSRRTDLAVTQHADPLPPGSTLAGRFRIDSAATGGVFRATDAQTGASVVLRVFPAAAWSPAAREHFRRRAAAAARVAHPNLAVLLDAGTDDAHAAEWVAWEALSGEPLSSLLAQRGTPPVPLGLRILQEAAAGVGAAHAAGLAHGGLHPAALFLSRGEADQRMRVRVQGFGAFAGVDVRSAAARYAAPEALRRQGPPAPAGDVWSLGVVAFELLAGLPPQWGATLAALARGQEAQLPSPRDLRPELPAPVADVVLRALAPTPADRWPDARAFADALARATSAPPAPAAVAVPPAPIPAAPAAPADATSEVSAPTPPAVAAALAFASVVGAPSEPVPPPPAPAPAEPAVPELDPPLPSLDAPPAFEAEPALPQIEEAAPAAQERTADPVIASTDPEPLAVTSDAPGALPDLVEASPFPRVELDLADDADTFSLVEAVELAEPDTEDADERATVAERAPEPDVVPVIRDEAPAAEDAPVVEDATVLLPVAAAEPPAEEPRLAVAYAPRRAPRFVPPSRGRSPALVGGAVAALALAAAAAWAMMQPPEPPAPVPAEAPATQPAAPAPATQPKGP